MRKLKISYLNNMPKVAQLASGSMTLLIPACPQSRSMNTGMIAIRLTAKYKQAILSIAYSKFCIDLGTYYIIGVY